MKDELISALISTLNTNPKVKGEKVAYQLGGTEEVPTDLKDWVGTGSDLLDIAISNRLYGGFPMGRIVTFLGNEGSGKSLLVAHTIASVQKKGGIGVLIDTENAVNEEFMKAVGVDVDKLIYIPADTIEKGLETIEKIITTIRLKDKNKPVVIALDSIAATSTDMEMEEDFTRQGYSTGKAIIMSKGLRKITQLIAKQKVLVVFTNQLRDKVESFGFGEKWTTPGGKAEPFHSSCRIKLTPIGKLTKTVDKQKQVIGVEVEAKIIKNRFGPPHRTARFNVYFSSGIDNYDSMYKMYLDLKIMRGEGDGAVFEYEDGDDIEKTNPETGEIPKKKVSYKFKNKQHFAENYDKVPFKSKMYELLAEKLIMKYDNKSPDDGSSKIDLDQTE